MSKTSLSEHQLQLWHQVAGLFRGDASAGGESAGVPEEESGVADASAVAEAVGEPGRSGSAESESESESKKLESAPEGAFGASSPGSSAAREETIRMIGEAIDVQTDFPGFGEVEKPGYLSEDLHHLLKNEDTEESLETMTEEGVTPPWETAGQGGGGAESAMPLPDDLTREDREGQAPPPQERQDVGRLNDPLRQEQAPEQSDVPPAEASAQAGGSEPGLEEREPAWEHEACSGEAEPEVAREGEAGGEAPSPRAFPRSAPEPGAPGQSGLPDIMQRATMQALRTAREAASRQSAAPEQVAGEELGTGLDPAAPTELPAEAGEEPASEDFLNDPVAAPEESGEQAESPGQVEGDPPEGEEQGGPPDDSREEPPSNNPFHSAPWGS